MRTSISNLILIAALAGTGCRETVGTGTSEAELCADGRKARAGVNLIQGAIRGLKDAKKRGVLTEEHRWDLCASLSRDLDRIAKNLAVNSSLNFVDHSLGEILRDGRGIPGNLPTPDFFLSAPHGRGGELETGVLSAYVAYFAAHVLTVPERVCVPGEEWQKQADGTQKLVSVPCKRSEYVYRELEGIEDAVALHAAILRAGAALGPVCGSGSYYDELGWGWRLQRDDDVPVASPEFDAAANSVLSIIEDEVLPNGISMYLAVECELEDAFARLGSPQRQPRSRESERHRTPKPSETETAPPARGHGAAHAA
jgi:hypothetical protein